MKQRLSAHIQTVQQAAFRMVESQEKSATMRLVDSFEEQDLLELLIETSKPLNESPERHYLISTPFRYPPLEYGSRFGGRFEPSLFYASHSIHTMLHETAYYSFYFMDAMAVPFPSITINHKTSFQVNVESGAYIDLSGMKQNDWQARLQDKQDYAFSQQVGTKMRALGIEAFSYTSARDLLQGLNMGVFKSEAIQGDPVNTLQWQIKQGAEEIMFSCTADKTLNQVIQREIFLMDGKIPSPSY